MPCLKLFLSYIPILAFFGGGGGCWELGSTTLVGLGFFIFEAS